MTSAYAKLTLAPFLVMTAVNGSCALFFLSPDTHMNEPLAWALFAFFAMLFPWILNFLDLYDPRISAKYPTLFLLGTLAAIVITIIVGATAVLDSFPAA
jgi:hypothetical protein